MDAHAERIGNALRLEAKRGSSRRWSWDRWLQRMTRWVGRPRSWLA